MNQRTKQERERRERERQVGGRPSVRATARADGSQTPVEFGEFLRKYAQEKPDVVALWCFGLGFVIGWKLKPW